MKRRRNLDREGAPVPAEPATATAPAAPVNVIVLVEPRRGRRARPKRDEGDDEGHPLLKTAVGLAIAKRLTRRRKRPLSKRVKTAVRKGRRAATRKAKRVVRKARRALR